MKKVITTNMSEKLHVAIKEFHKIVPAGIEFMVTDSRFTILSGYNNYHAIFVTEVIGEDTPPEVVLHGDLVEQVPEQTQVTEEPIVREETPAESIEEQVKEKSTKRKTKKIAE